MVAWLSRVLVRSSLRIVLAYPNLAMHSNWPLLHLYTNGVVKEIEERRKEKKKEKRRELLLIVVTTSRSTTSYERRERRVFFSSPFFFYFFFLLLLFSSYRIITIECVLKHVNHIQNITEYDKIDR